MKFDFSDENFEKARIHYREASNKHARALKLYESGDYAGCVESSQHAIELYIKTLFVQSGNKIPKTHDPGNKIDPIIKELKRINSELLKNAKIDIFTRIKFISNQAKSLHTTAMYGLDGTPPSMLFTHDDAAYYFSLAQEILFTILLVAFIFGHHYENIPEEGRKFLETVAPEFYKKEKDDKEKKEK